MAFFFYINKVIVWYGSQTKQTCGLVKAVASCCLKWCTKKSSTRIIDCFKTFWKMGLYKIENLLVLGFAQPILWRRLFFE
jgi:hypothetical protein